jgi:regulator of nucleoside diphosphate kinase
MHRYETSHPQPDIRITKRDLEQLDVLIGYSSRNLAMRVVDFLVDELMRAQIVDTERLPGATVVMNAKVEYRDEESGAHRVVTLVYPEDKHKHADGVSVMTLVGAALLGLSEGQSMPFLGSDGRPRVIKVLRVWQPGASSADGVS